MTDRLSKTSLRKMNGESLDTLALERFATPLPEGLTKDEKIAMLLEMQAQDEADQQDHPGPEDSTPEEEAPKVHPSQGHVYVRIANAEGAGGDQPVFLQVNGFSVYIHREKWVKLRKLFLSSLRDAEETHFFQDEEGNKQEKRIRRFNVDVRSLEQGIPDEQDELDVY